MLHLPWPNFTHWLTLLLAEIAAISFRLLLLLSEKGTILDQSWRQLREYDSQASQVLPWLNSTEERLGGYMAQSLKSDAAVIKQRINDLKVSRKSSALYCYILVYFYFAEKLKPQRSYFATVEVAFFPFSLLYTVL